MIPRVLSIAGTDPSGGAGIQADLKSIGTLGGYGMAVVTALVAQNTQGVRTVHVPPVAFLVEQLDAVSDDVRIDAVKLGMLHSAPLIAAVADWLARTHPPICVLDPVMVATSGHALIDRQATEAIRGLCDHVDLVTPNIPELGVLVDAPAATTWDQAVAQAKALATASRTTVLLKGGHLVAEDCPDAIVTANDVTEVAGRRIATRATHGTGCSLSSAMATLAASGLSWPDALARAKTWLVGAIEHGAALDVGTGNGPVDHFHELRPHLPATGWCDGAWKRTADLRARVDACAFVSGLRSGRLDPARFRWYLAQDALYLSDYSRVLARASVLAASAAEQAFWAQCAVTALTTEAELHRSRLDGIHSEPAATTLAYVNHLHAVAGTGSYAEVVAAVLPCFWLYADLGRRLAAADHDAHPYHDWLGTYGDPAFEEATRTAIAITDRAAGNADTAQRARMTLGFERSMRHELEFFLAPTR
ncbi:bifunctional hydroxymethylpyrimidine kinase/phosphomethylpyrimidine kinase [Stenotrophomonas sp. MMGLT7]|uniref:bifunctional hydroxymethylpyrimidine kinase/phosphomethylpyrimidine kinase n=1 Tax=Stenotrophomonas sp. MMGLT7 TaxID=2901227 RepID=UPI001E5D84FF|nr:bifunctional hydroxymethylpyrimidine kinase/phosphomethylpyrimidine kinase [Stenotrophomonas sp. MMGLT7]MCD7098074.1 bifunctional hydroxymethylpyrimidine kinase/phosphomethylpyrimidine kinase [Stenotrophomonas sp. MMGLT7]